MFEKILIANRGEIACRVIDTAERLGIATVAVFSDADRDALHVRRADEAIHIGASASADSYLRIDRIIDAARRTGAAAVHPGYGFLSENPAFVEAVEAAGLAFVGPGADAIRAMGLKDAAKRLMAAAGVPVVPGYHGDDQSPDTLAAHAGRIGYPVLIKARAGGGGRGMRRVDRPEDFATALASAVREAEAAFGDGAVLIERYITSPRHIEVQVMGDAHGNLVHLYERDCTLQRRYQKVIEEAPAPGMSDAVRATMTDAALAAARAVDYRNAGTVEFIIDGANGVRADGFWFMEMNTRLQVEHPVTEAVTGIDLVEWQLRVAAGEPLPMTQNEIPLHGHAIEARLCAEDPTAGFLPSTGRLQRLAFGPARIDTGVAEGDAVSPFYDSMIAKLTVRAASRTDALISLRRALRATHVAGVASNVDLLLALVSAREVADAAFDTGLVERDLERFLTPAGDPIDALCTAALCASHPSADLIGTSGGPWWRVWGSAHQRVHLRSAGERHEIEIERRPDGTATLVTDDRTVEVSDIAFDGRSLRFDRDGSRVLASCASWQDAGGGVLSVRLAGTTRDYRLPDAAAGARNNDATAGDHVMTPMSGTVIAVHAQVGDAVESGQPLAVLEAMKMEHVLSAPRDGHVADVRVAVGDRVGEAEIVMVLTDPSGATPPDTMPDRATSDD